MAHSDEVRDLLKTIESEKGVQVNYTVSAIQERVGDVQVNVYPVVGDAACRIFNLHDGLTPITRQVIREWFEPFLH